jgi:hypothetical protein
MVLSLRRNPTTIFFTLKNSSPYGVHTCHEKRRMDLMIMEMTSQFELKLMTLFKDTMTKLMQE